MVLTAHQPVYLPWLGLFHKIVLADMYCFFDEVQYQKKDYNNRNRIKTNAGEVWLTVPVQSKDHHDKKVGRILIQQDGWQRKHLRSIELAYGKAKFFDEYMPGLKTIIQGRSSGSLGELNLALLEYLIDCLGIKTPIVKASDYTFEDSKSDLVLDMCKKLGANKYIFGVQGRNYADIGKFEQSGVMPYFQDYQHPKYSQLHGGFLPNMSVIDLLFNEGPASRRIILENNITASDLDNDYR